MHRPLLALGCAALLLLAAACGSKSKPAATSAPGLAPSPQSAAPVTAVAPTTAAPTAALATPTPAASPTETPDTAAMSKLVIPKISVRANFVTLGIIASTNTMDSPKTKDDVGYYNFTPTPTYGGNTVLSGHVDWFTGETGVFWDLKKLTSGDEIDILLQDNRTIRYAVVSNTLYDDADAPVDQIIGDTPKESVTLITCEGVFDKASAEYDKRRVVRAERLYP